MGQITSINIAGFNVPVTRRRQPTQPIHERPPSPPSSASDDEQKEGWPDADEDYVPGIDAPAVERDRGSSPDIPLANLRVARPRASRATVTSSRNSSGTVPVVTPAVAAPLVIPEPTPEATAIYQDIQQRFDIIRALTTSLINDLDPHNLVSLGEVKENPMPRITNMDTHTANLTTIAHSITTKGERLLKSLDRWQDTHTKGASLNYTGRAMSETMLEQERVQREIRTQQNSIQRAQEALNRLTASLPAGQRPSRNSRPSRNNPRPTRRQRLQ